MNHGRHLKIVGFAVPRDLGDLARVRGFLELLVPALGMRMLGSPVMHDVAVDLAKMNVEPFEDEGGVTGTAVLSTSHCAIHTWPAREFFVLDVYSCRDFRPEIVLNLLQEQLGMTQVRVTDLSHALTPPSAD